RRSICTSASNQTKLNGKATFQVYTTDERETKREKPSFDNERHFKRCKSLPILNTTGSWTPANKPTSVMQQVSAYAETVHENKIDLEIDEEGNETLDESSKDGPADYNEPESTTYQPKIPSDQLVEYLDEKSHDGLSSEFGTFTCGLVKPYVESQKTENIYKNRYKGIYPYDDSRVKGYNKPQQYIATLGPTSKQLGDFSLFWKMIWQQRVEKVVMVTNLTEQGYPKCEQYWPNPGTTKTFGAIEVKSSSEDEYAEFTRRAFTGIDERTVHHLHFTCWPVRAIPDDVTAMIEFRQRVLITPSTLNGPTVVHCSAGVGRTGIYIALDILTEEGEVERAIDIAGCVHKMRQNRPNMVQTLKQYQFLHKAAVYSLTFDCKQIKGENFKQYMNNHSTKELNNQFIVCYLNNTFSLLITDIVFTLHQKMSTRSSFPFLLASLIINKCTFT
ncbi:LAR-like protein, partial [Mya arenaria]